MSTRQGVFAQAHTGTLFIDEITELAPHLQAKLLRVIQTGEFTMVGGSQPQRVNVRIITATNRDLKQAVAKRLFREDLYFRIAVIRIPIPPLRERRDDIPLLVAHFLRAFLTSGRRQEIRGLTERAMTALMTYSWPGNVRQLKNWIEQALVLADGEGIDLEHFPSLTRELAETPGAAVPLAPPGLRLEELERWYVLDTLQARRWQPDPGGAGAGDQPARPAVQAAPLRQSGDRRRRARGPRPVGLGRIDVSAKPWVAEL